MVAIGVNNNTSFALPLTAGRVDVTARPLQQGRTRQLRHVDIVDEARRLITTDQVRLVNTIVPISGIAAIAAPARFTGR
jgi:acyl-coenzyme A thioesterase PaaI-like protein